ncbi:MAG: hypothetical protein JSW11_13070 [Candidatus Heimdallarchaeota archaeon]|nr:MAG: hypothetical protein JSW11_13070 [Candidatus Heimdallarchaeota archaeon]
MKKKLDSSLNIFLIVMIVSSLFVTINYKIDHGSSMITRNLYQDGIEQIDFDSLNFLDVSTFTNKSHQINVSRVITANEYGYTTSRTEINLYNYASQPIDAFNYTIPSHEFEDTKFWRIFSPNKTDSDSMVLAQLEENNSVLLVIQTPSVEENQSVSIIIEMDHPNAVTFDEGAKLEESAHPYQFNLSFLPLLSMPITSYELEWKLGQDTNVRVKNESIQPTSDYFQGDFSGNTTYGLIFRNVTGLSTIDRRVLSNSEYGGYNLTSLENREFIPAYIPTLRTNFTSYLSFEYYQNVNTKIEFTELKSVVTVSEWGFVTTTYEIELQNIGIKSGSSLSTALGGPTFPKISFYLPESAQKIGFRDNYGNLTPSVSSDPVVNRKLVEITPRVQIEQHEKYDMHISYRERVADIMKDLGGGKVQLQIPLSLSFNWTVQKFEWALLLPSGSRYNITRITNGIETSTSRESNYNSSIRERTLLSLFDKKGLALGFENLTPLSNHYLSVEFNIPLSNFVQVPLSLSIFFLLIGLSYIFVRNLSFGFRGKKIAIEEIPLDLIKDFVKTYEEKTAIREQILRLDRKRKSRNISAREYEQTRIILRNRQQGIDRSIVSISKKLAEEGPRYRISMRSIEVAEANREDILINIESLERKKTQGRIGKDAYAKLKINYDKQLRKVNNEVDKVLIDLRSLLTK